MLRAGLYTLWLARRRLARRTGTAALVALGIAAGAAVVFGVRVGATVAQDRAVAGAIERVPDGSRSVRAVWFGVPGQSADTPAELDRRARTALARAGAGAPTSLVLLRESTLAGTFAGLGGVDGLGRWVALREGRLPRTCRPERCEVLRLRGEGRVPEPPDLRLVEVGSAALRSRVLFGDFLAPTDNALADAEVSPAVAAAAGYHRPPPAPLFLAEGVDALADARSLATVYRSHAWVAPLRPGAPRLWEIDDLAAGVARARSELQARSTAFDLVAPVEELRAAQAAAREGGRRLGLVGAQAAALLFAFALLAALTGRRDLLAARRRLAWFGARRWQLALLSAAEAAALAVTGTLLGAAAGMVAGAVVAQRSGAPATAVLGHSVLTGGGALLALAVAAAAATVLAIAARAAAPRLGRVAISPLDVAAAAALAGVVALSRGDADGDTVLLLPALATFAAAVVAARLLQPALRVLEGVARRRAFALRVAALSLARDAGYATAATAFLVVSVGLALFAEGYRATLAQGQRDAAAFAVPRDFLVRQDPRRLIPVLDAAGATAVHGAEPDRVLRLTGSVARFEGESGVTLLGLPPASLPKLHGWRESFARRPRAELARLVDAPGTLAGTQLPPGLRRLRVRASGTGVAVRAEIAAARGRFVFVELGDAEDAVLDAPLPPAARGGRLVGFSLAPTSRLAERGADAGKAATGTVALQLPDVPGALDGWIGVGGAERDGDEFRYTLTSGEVTRIRPPQPSDEAPPPVLATRRLAAAADAAGLLPLQIAGERVTVRVVEVVERFPGATGEVVVGDVDALAALLNTARPGAARPNELWVGAASAGAAAAVARELRTPPLHVLETVSRAELEREAARDPLAYGTLLALVTAALVALVLGLVGLLLTVRGDVRDERGELFDLEAQGAAPALLRRVVRLRAVAVGAAGVPLGILAGLALAPLVTELVSATARVEDHAPPLRYALDPLLVGGAFAAFVLLATLAVVVATRRAFREPVPRPAEVLE